MREILKGPRRTRSVLVPPDQAKFNLLNVVEPVAMRGFATSVPLALENDECVPIKNSIESPQPPTKPKASYAPKIHH